MAALRPTRFGAILAVADVPAASAWCRDNLGFAVEDCRGAYAELLGKGVRFLTEPFSPPWGGARVFAVDPDGYLVELEELPR